MNKHHFKSLYGAMRGVGLTKMPPMLLMSYEKPVMLAVFNNRLPGRDPLMERQYRAVTFAMYGDHAPKPLQNEYTFAGKLHGGDVSKVV